jgi:multiple sugar transport system ATP-binding protein
VDARRDSSSGVGVSPRHVSTRDAHPVANRNALGGGQDFRPVGLARSLLRSAAVRALGLEAVRKDYDDRTVIPRLDLAIPARAFVVLVGPSGSGKTTTLKLIAGLESPSAGRILLAGRDVTATPPGERDVATVGLGDDLDPAKLVRDQIPNAPLVDRLGLRAVLDRFPRALSSGQRRCVAIARALVRRPQLFLFDDPLAKLDARLRDDLRSLLVRVHAETKAASLYVTHDQAEAMTLAHQIVVLKDGVVQQVGTPSEIYDTPANRYVAGFFGTPAMNFLAADVHARDGRSAARGSGFEIPLASLPAADKVVVAIRPESLSLVKRDDEVGLAGAVAAREVRGAEVVLHIESAAGPLALRTDAASPARPGDTVAVWLDPKAIHVFDSTTERRLH